MGYTLKLFDSNNNFLAEWEYDTGDIPSNGTFINIKPYDGPSLKELEGGKVKFQPEDFLRLLEFHQHFGKYVVFNIERDVSCSLGQTFRGDIKSLRGQWEKMFSSDVSDPVVYARRLEGKL